MLDSTVVAINHLNWFRLGLSLHILVGYEYPDPDDEDLRGHSMALLKLSSSVGGSVEQSLTDGFKLSYEVVADMSVEFEQVCPPTSSPRLIAQQYYSSFIPSW
jgi:hypothetical protein